MRIHRVLLLMFFATIFGCNIRNEKIIIINSNDPSLIQRGKYLFFNNKPAEGKVIEYYSSHKIKSEAYYKDGLLNGMYRSWYEGGQRESERFYSDGEKDRLHAGWWPNGNPKFQYHFSRGSYHGSFKEWYENGKRLHDFQYEHGAEVSAIGWRENGKTYINFAVRNGKKYGLTNSRLCFSLKDEQGVYQLTSIK